MKKCCVLLVLSSLLCFATAGKLPSTFEVCKRSDPELEKCFARAIQHAFPYVKDPIPELGIPSIDPMKIDRITVEAGSTGAVNVTQRLKNIEIHNVLNGKVTKTEIELGDEKVKFAVHIYNKQYRVEADYEIEGNVLVLPIVGSGRAHLVLDDVPVDISLTGEFYEKNDKRYIKLTDVKVNFTAGNVKFDLENLFNGDETLGREMNKVVNENWKEVFEDMLPAYNKAFELFYKSVFGAVFGRVSYDELFPL